MAVHACSSAVSSIRSSMTAAPWHKMERSIYSNDIPFPSSSSPCRQGLQPSSHYRRRTPRVLSRRASILQLLLNLGKDGGNNVAIVSVDVEPGAEEHEVRRGWSHRGPRRERGMAGLSDDGQHLNVDAYPQEPTTDAAGPITRLRLRPKDGQTVANRVHAQDGVEEGGDDAGRWHFDEGDEGDPALSKERTEPTDLRRYITKAGASVKSTGTKTLLAPKRRAEMVVLAPCGWSDDEDADGASATREKEVT
ncbi:hypothetical protein EYR36_010686 [Pleurotus pulmonarius]|nr:hypothetical protein EYR36_010686 [Pleurotus pulmonarius]